METDFSQQIVQVLCLFKSYYVVWKPQEKEEKYFEMESLNRTM